MKPVNIKCLACARYSRVLGCVSDCAIDTFLTSPPGACDNSGDCADFKERTGVSLYEMAMSNERDRQNFDLFMEKTGIGRDEEMRQLFIETLKNADSGATYVK